MKALTFLEWYFKSFQTTEIYKLRDVANFYNQPFTVDFLVNPVMADGVNIKPLIQQSESLRLFEGWRINKSEYAKNVNGNIYSMEEGYTDKVVYQDNNKFYIKTGYSFDIDGYEYYYGLEFHTFNDFITLCNLAGIELRFNKSNETIKKLFGKE